MKPLIKKVRGVIKVGDDEAMTFYRSDISKAIEGLKKDCFICGSKEIHKGRTRHNDVCSDCYNMVKDRRFLEIERKLFKNIDEKFGDFK